ncbi:beta-1,3-galactosyltransferase, putative [Pediculus humanus corporis]|uniref:Hexosyltransferase n=1 Tax=Pediculus humanus subsp. corporis TaxID=121224 RepID=E0VB64_PEDHC|nr:beta-1,3-galactosyltransferase, putative [Pediculus humanus corporis]EEB10620.1 beta-1,3-galactosyltransferase, putative [Pediculus humanus corporis]
MAPPSRTLFVILVSVTGFVYFLYTIYTSSLDGPLYRVAVKNKGFGNESISTSSRMEKKEKSLSNLYAVLSSISNKNNNNNNNSIFNLNQIISDKLQDKKIFNAPTNKVPNNNNLNNNNNTTKDNPSSSLSSSHSANGQSSVIQKVPPKSENVTGIATRSLYDSGFRVPNVDLCPDFGQHLKLIILITSAPNHVEARKAIRQTWGHFRMRKDVSMAFVLGRSLKGNESYIKDENSLYEDIILGSFIDSYNNLTLKTTSMLEWVDNYCNKAKFVLKTDDDMFINIPKKKDFIGKHGNDKRKIFGKLASKWKPIRKKASKYYVSLQQYKHSIFPSFTTGPAYLITSDVIHDLYTTALNMTYLKLEDVFMTGIVAQEKGIRRVHVPEFLNRRLSVTSCYIHKAISIHMVKPFEQYDLWKRLLDGRTKC